jgi:hypothetical protein
MGLDRRLDLDEEIIPGAGDDVFGVTSLGSGIIAVGRSGEGGQPGVIATRTTISRER